MLAVAVQPDRNGSNATDPSADVGASVTSIYALAFHPEVGELPPGAIYVCRARIMPGANAEQPAKGSGNSAGCALEIPFAWQANRPQPAATLSYEVDAVSVDGRVLRSVERDGLPLPAPMADTKAYIELSF
jgi:hypothetical protein